MIFAVWSRLCRRVHRALCFVGIHASNSTFECGKDADGKWVPIGWFCGVCCKSWDTDKENS
jgi:hypothetical protein